MSNSTWYYLSKGWFRRTHRVGPLSEQQLLQCIDRGKIVPATMVRSEKTRNKWVPMNRIAPAMKHYRKTHPEEGSATSPAKGSDNAKRSDRSSPEN